MNRSTTSTAIPTRALKFEALANISASFELFCLASGMEALGEMMDHDARAICGPRDARGHDRRAHRWGKTRVTIGFHGGKVEIERPRLRSFEGKEQALPSWEAAVAEDWLGKWAMNQMLINVSTRKFARSVRLPEGDVPAPMGSGLSKSAASRRFVALSAARMKEWVASDLSVLDLLVIQIDGIHMDEDLILVAAIGVDAKGDKHPLGLIEGATENAATVSAHRQSRRARARPGGAAALHHRRREGPVQRDPPNLRTRRGDPALSGAQGPQHNGAIAQIAARFGPARVATSMGTGRRRQGRKADSQPPPASRTRLARGRRLDPRRHRRDTRRHAAWIRKSRLAAAPRNRHQADG